MQEQQHKQSINLKGTKPAAKKPVAARQTGTRPAKTAAAKDKIKLYLLTGFLGSGKTTLILNLLEQFEQQNKKLAVIVNEFGQVSVDGPVLEQASVHIQELNNGSIFCKCLEGRFVEALVEISERKPDVVLVESTGLADPSGMQDIMRQVNRQTDSAYAYSGVICLADAKNYLRISQSLMTISRQILASTLIVINKADLVTPDLMDEVRQKIRRVNPLAHIIETSYGQISIDQLTKVRQSRLGRRLKTLNTRETRPDLFILHFTDPVNPSDLSAFLEHFKPLCHRIKGFVHTPEGLIHVDGVAGEMELKPSQLTRDGSDIVLIPSQPDQIDEQWEQDAARLLQVSVSSQ